MRRAACRLGGSHQPGPVCAAGRNTAPTSRLGEGQALGNALSFGGPYLGFFAMKMKDVRKSAGRIVGETVDGQGRRGFVLTLSTREQHIRREKASSNICTNEALNALAAAIYMAAMGKNGLRTVAELCYHKAHYAAGLIGKLPGFEVVAGGPFFKEFVVRCPHAGGNLNAGPAGRLRHRRRLRPGPGLPGVGRPHAAVRDRDEQPCRDRLNWRDAADPAEIRLETWRLDREEVGHA